MLSIFVRDSNRSAGHIRHVKIPGGHWVAPIRTFRLCSRFPNYFMETQYDGYLRSPLLIDGKEVLPLGGIANSRTVLCNEPGHYAFSATAMGSTTLTAHGTPCLPTYWRWVILSPRLCVSPPHHFMGQVADVIPKTLNLALAERPYGLAGLAEYGPALKPRVVLWFSSRATISKAISILKNEALFFVITSTVITNRTL